MERRLAVALAALLVVPLAAACSPEDGDSHPGDVGGDHGDTAGCSSVAPFCSADGRSLVRCDPATGAIETLETCYPDRACRLGACVSTVCPPGDTRCVDTDTQERCRSDGSAWETLDCPAGNLCNSGTGMCTPTCQLRMFVLLDRSGSMSEGTPRKWDQARDALRALMASPVAAEIQFGFGTFPTDGNCAVDGFVSYPVPDASATIIDSYFTGNDPNGNTPLGFVFESLAADTSAANLDDPTYYNALLLVSDGVDTCYVDCLTRCGFNFSCLMACETEAETLVTEAVTTSTIALRDRQIRTYVIGFGADVSDVELSAIASNGGTVDGVWYRASNVDDLNAALQAIIADMFECNPIVIL